MALNVQRALSDDVELANQVRQLLEDRGSRRLVGGTSITAYRRVHEVLASVLDRMLEAVRNKRDVRSFAVELARCLVLVRYQAARGQISRDLSQHLTRLLDSLLREVQSGSVDYNRLERMVERSRVLLDALAVLVYQLGRK